MGSRRPWTEPEVDALERNYKRYGGDVDAWDERIDRTRRAVVSKAEKLGLACPSRRGSSIDLADQRRLEYVVNELCGRLGVSRRQLAREVALIAARAGR